MESEYLDEKKRSKMFWPEHSNGTQLKQEKHAKTQSSLSIRYWGQGPLELLLEVGGACFSAIV